MFNIQRIKNPYIFLPLIIIAIFLIFILIPTSQSYLSYSSDPNDIMQLGMVGSTFNYNQPIVVTVILDTQGQTINAAKALITYDPHILSVQSVETSSSFCLFYTDRKTDPIKGTVNLECGKPRPGFNGKNAFETITFKPLTYAKTKISIDPKSLVLKNDGKGTNILKRFESRDISVILSQ